MNRLRTRLRAGGGGSGVDADAAAWASAVTANSGTYSGSTLAAVNTKIKALKAANLWAKKACTGFLCGDQLAAALIQYKLGVWAPATNVNFVGGDYTEATGLTGNGSTKYLNIGLVPSVSLTANDTHMMIYNRSGSLPAVSVVHMGAGVSPDFFELIAPATSTGNIVSRQYNDVAGRLDSSASTAPVGMVVASRTATGSHVIYKNGSPFASNATNGGTLSNVNTAMFVFGTSRGGTLVAPAADVLSAYSVGSGLSAADVANEYTIEQAFQAALGRSV